MTMKMGYKYKGNTYDSEEDMIEAYRKDYSEAQKEKDEADLRRLKMKNLIWSNRKNIIWIIVTISPLIVLGIVKLIELIQKWLN